MKDTVKINRLRVSIESIATDTLLSLLANPNYSTSALSLSSTQRRFMTFSQYSVIHSMTAHFPRFSDRKSNESNKDK